MYDGGMNKKYNIVEDDELEALLLTHSPKLREILAASRQEIRETGGIPHDEFWQQVDAAYEEPGAVPSAEL